MSLFWKTRQRLAAFSKTVAAILKNSLGSSENDTENAKTLNTLDLRDRVLKLICFRYNYSNNYT